MATGLERFVPRASAEWLDRAGDRRWMEEEATMCFVDISGFTNLSEKLARRGRIGAEELTEVLNHVFGSMLELAYDRRGSLLKFGGDALLLMFRGDDHVGQGCDAAVEMRAALREAANLKTSVGRVALRMSVGVHTGTLHMFRVGSSHNELIVCGPTASRTTDMEGTADAGEIVISSEVRDVLGHDAAPRSKGDGFILRWRKPRLTAPGPQHRPPSGGDEVRSCVPVALRDHLTGDLESEHRLVTIGFVKFKGTDDMLAAQGPEALADALHQLVTATQRAVDEEGVTFLATDVDANGGKIILTGGVPLTQDDDEGRVLRSVRRLADTDQQLSIQVGVNRGHVFAGEIGTPFRSTYTVIGDTVNLAARLMAAAGPNEIYASPGALDRARSLFETKPLEPFHVKGKEEPVHAFAVGEEAGGRAATTRYELPFGGRDAELETVRAAIEADLAGSGRGVDVVGETGIGKTRLVEEAVSGLDGAAVFTIRAEPYGRTSPYRAFRDTARSLLGVRRGENDVMAAAVVEAVGTVTPHLLPLAPLLGRIAHVDMDPTPEVLSIEPRFLQDRLADVVIEMLDAVLRDRTVLVIEDGHWMDDASAHLLARLEHAAGGRSWAVVNTRRPEDTGFRLSAPTSLELGPLGPEAVEAMIIAATSAAPLRPQEIEALVHRCGGSPLFLEELLGAIREHGTIDELPDTLDAVVGASIDSLPVLPRQVLRQASVLGRSFRVETLQELLAAESISVDQATRAVLRLFLDGDGTGRLRFRHALVCDVAYQGIAYRRRRVLHCRAGGILEADAGEDVAAIADIISLHFAEGQAYEKAWRYSKVAGERAEAAYANIDAAAQYERAVQVSRHVHGISDHDRAEVFRHLGDVRLMAGVFDGALDAYTKALRLGRDDPAFSAQVLLSRARAKQRVGRMTDALRDVTKGRRLVSAWRDLEAGSAAAQLASFAAVVRVSQQRPRAVLADASAAVEIAEQVGDVEAMGHALMMLDWAHIELGEPDAATNAEIALELFESAGAFAQSAEAKGNMGYSAYFDGRWDDAVALWEETREDFLRVGDVAYAALASTNIADVRLNQGRPEEARPLLEEAVRVARATQFVHGATLAETLLARVELAEGAVGDAEARLQRCRAELLALDQRAHAAECSLRLAECRLATGDPAGALDLLPGADDDPDMQPLLPVASRLRCQTEFQLGYHDRAAVVLREGLDSARAQGLEFDGAMLVLLADELGFDGLISDDDLGGARATLSRMGVVRDAVRVTSAHAEVTGVGGV